MAGVYTDIARGISKMGILLVTMCKGLPEVLGGES